MEFRVTSLRANMSLLSRQSGPSYFIGSAGITAGVTYVVFQRSFQRSCRGTVSACPSTKQTLIAMLWRLMQTRHMAMPVLVEEATVRFGGAVSVGLIQVSTQ